MKCEQVNKLLFAYVDGELNESDSKEIEEHLSQCPACRNLKDFQLKIKGNLKEQSNRYTAPSNLKNSIMDSLQDDSSRGFAFSLNPVYAFILALAFMIVAFYGSTAHNPEMFSQNKSSLVVKKGHICCIGCEYHKHHTDKPHPCKKFGHTAALMTEDGKIWSFFPTENTDPLRNFDKSEGKKVKVKAEFFREAQYVKVKSFKQLKGAQQYARSNLGK